MIWETNLPSSQLVSDTDRICPSNLFSSKDKFFLIRHSASKLKQSFHFAQSLSTQKRGKKTSQFFTFVQYESYPTFLSSFSSYFLWLFHRNTTNWILIFSPPYSYHHPLRTNSPAFFNLVYCWTTIISQTHCPWLTLQRMWSFEEWYENWENGRRNESHSHTLTFLLCLITFPWWQAES